MIKVLSALSLGVIIMTPIVGSPTGPHGVGTTQFHMVDTMREETRKHESTHGYRELMVQVWYPAQIEGLKCSEPYVSERLAAFIKEKSPEKRSWFFGSGYIGAGVLTHSYANAPVASAQNRYPVLIFSPGYGCPCHTYTSILEELASNGFVVFGVNHTYTSDPVEFPDGRITELAQDAFLQDEACIRFHDIKFVLDRIQRLNGQDALLAQRLDLGNVGVFGHSMGATVALEVGQQDARFKAVVALDGMVNQQTESYAKPLMIMYNSEQGTFAANDSEAPPLDLVAIFEAMKKSVGALCRSSANDVFEIQWKAHHMTFSDYFMLTHQAKEHTRELRNLEQVKFLITEFFKVYLDHDSKNEFVAKLKESGNLRYTSYSIDVDVF